MNKINKLWYTNIIELFLGTLTFGLLRWLSGQRIAGDAGSILGSGRSPGGSHGNPNLVFLPGESHGQEEPSGLQSTGSQRVRLSEVTEHACTLMLMGFPRWLSGKESACQCGRHRKCEFDPWVGKIPWRRTWQPTPVFLPGESHGSLVGYRSWGYKKSDMS